MADPHDTLDRRLRDQGARWRESRPKRSLDVESVLASTSRRRPWTPMIAAAVAVVVVLGLGTWFAVDRDSSATPTSPTPTPSGNARAGVVPWKPLPATHPKLPVVRIPARPSEAGAADLPRCTTDQLRHHTVMGAAGGTEYLVVTLRLQGSRPCRVQGRPAVQLLSDGQPVDVPISRGPSVDNFPGGPVALTPDRTAVIRMGWAAGHYCGPVKRVDQVRIELAGSGGPFEVRGFGRTYCSPGEGVTSVFVPPVEPAHYRPAHTRSPYEGVTATGDLDVTSQPGATVDFTITLTSKHDLPLAPCPDYTVLVAGAEGSAHRYALNCAAVPHHDAQGTPYLPAGVPVTFAMRARAGSSTSHKLIWYVNTPDERPNLNGTLTVRPDRSAS